MENVIKEPAIVSGLSSGAILALWLGANARKNVKAVISEDPPLFSSMYPRIKKEKYMHYLFETMIDMLGKPERDIKGFFARQGFPHPKGGNKLLFMPSFIANYIATSLAINKKLRPKKPYDLLNASFYQRIGLKFISEYDVDFSRATIDGRLTKGFSPVNTLKKIKCPVLLIQAIATRHEYWGIIGALDDNDVKKAESLVKDIKVVKVNSYHDVHLSKPKIYTQVVTEYLKELKNKEKSSTRKTRHSQR